MSIRKNFNSKKFWLLAVVTGFLVAASLLQLQKKDQNENILSTKPRVWSVKSVDTMKYSRDLALSKLNDPTFDKTIDLQVRVIKETGATHVAIGTPYDERFLPYLRRWVQTARKYGLNVWFRGNFAGWEGWFGSKRNLTREEHLNLTRQFIQKHGGLFQNGDIFTSCTECENGGPGDPRYQTDVGGFRNFLIQEYNITQEEFSKIGKKVATNLFSMNYDVAKLVMDGPTVAALGNLIVIDHYVKTPEQLAGDIRFLANKTGAKIILGEFGAPIPDIHGSLTETQQAEWVEKALNLISIQPEVVGLNYWTSFGGTTSIFNTNNTPKLAAKVLERYFKLPALP